MSVARIRSSFWHAVPDVRPAERARFLFFSGLSALLGVGLTVGLIASEALLLGHAGVEALPRAFVWAALATVIGSLVYASGVGRVRNDDYFIGVLGVAMLGVGSCALALVRGGSGALPTLFCLFFVIQAVSLNHYWTFTWDYFDARATRRLFPLLTAAQSFGGLLGAGLTVAVSRVAPAEALLVLWVLLMAATALLLRAARRSLRRWGPLDLEEADETSIEGLRAAFGTIHRSPLGRWLILSMLAMVISLFLAQYLYSDLFVRSFPSVAELVRFLALFLIGANALEIVLEALVTPRLIRRFGVPTANLLHPLLTLGSFLGLLLVPGVAAAGAARANRELIENAVAAPVRNLVYSALPFRLRGRIRAFLEAIVVHIGMGVVGGLLLLLGEDVSTGLLSGLGLLAAGVFLLSSLGVRGAYLGALAEQLRVGRLDLSELGPTIGSWEASRLADLWRALLRETLASTADLDLAELLARRGIVSPLLEALSHADPRVRRACARALAQAPAARAEEALRGTLDDSEPSVRLAGLEALRELSWIPGSVGTRALLAQLRDADPEVRAEAALQLGPNGRDVLREMALSSEVATARAALRRLPAELAALALERIQDPDPVVRAESLLCVARGSDRTPLPATEISAALADPSPRVRRAAVDVLASLGDPAAADSIGRALGDPAREVREAAIHALAGLRDVGVQAASQRLSAADPSGVEAALAVLAAVGTVRSRARLGVELRRQVHLAWRTLVLLSRLGSARGRGLPQLRMAYQNTLARSIRTVFQVLAASEHARLVRSVVRALRFGSARTRADALEVLSNLGDRETARLLAMLMEPGPLEDKIPLVGGLFPPPKDVEEIIEIAGRSRDPWVRRAHRVCADTGPVAREREDEMERLLHLRRVPLFSQLMLEQLEAINRMLSEAQYADGEVICREGEIGSELYLLISGEVEIFRNHGTPEQVSLARERPVTCFGEMAVLSDEPRNATVVAHRDVHLLTLEATRVKDMILETPEIAFEFFRVLTSRLTATNQRFERLARSIREG